MSTIPSIDSIVESFPHQTIPTIQGLPNYEAIADMLENSAGAVKR